MIPNSKLPEDFVVQFTRRRVNDSRINVLVTEIISVQTMDVSLFIEFANVTNYEHLLVFVRYNRKPDLTSNTYDKMFLIKVTGKIYSWLNIYTCIIIIISYYQHC